MVAQPRGSIGASHLIALGSILGFLQDLIIAEICSLDVADIHRQHPTVYTVDSAKA